MTVQDRSSLISLAGLASPEVAENSFVAVGARLIGEVRLEPGSSVWYNAVLRADTAAIVLGEGSNLQDGVVVHADPGSPCLIGRGVSVGHNAVVHGAIVGDNVLIGMGATVLNGARIGENTLIAGGALILENAQIPAGSLVAGVPGKVRRALSAEEIAGIADNAARYREHAKLHAGPDHASA